MNSYWRIDFPDDSTILCYCGGCFTWSYPSPDLEAWLKWHVSHVDEPWPERLAWVMHTIVLFHWLGTFLPRWSRITPVRARRY